jgi:hypothetical protein
MSKKQVNNVDPEIVAISDVYAALKDLDLSAQSRVLTYVANKLEIDAPSFETRQEERQEHRQQEPERKDANNAAGRQDDEVGDLEGISPVAKKWMTRNGLNPTELSTVFSLGVDDIDLIAQTVPGKNKKDKLRSVFLLQGIAAYLGTGAARFTHEKMKEAGLHYDAFDATNFATNLRSLSSEVSGSKDTGYTLNARGVAAATEMVKAITQSDKTK